MSASQKHEKITEDCKTVQFLDTKDTGTDQDDADTSHRHRKAAPELHESTPVFDEPEYASADVCEKQHPPSSAHDKRMTKCLRTTAFANSSRFFEIFADFADFSAALNFSAASLVHGSLIADLAFVECGTHCTQ
jgi:hypothetical protein